MAERQFGPYRLVRQIAVGGMAEIHLAKTKGIAGFEKYVALKMIHPNFAEDEQFIQMLVDEAKIAVQLNHANIAQTFDLGRVGENFYITMEYVDGADLYKVLRKASEIDVEMPLEVAAYIAKEVASALDHAHRKRDHTGKPLGIVHRDISPQNVLISFNGEVKLVDFGIAKATMKARQTAVGVIKGKYYYMSPEQAWGDPIDSRSDIFSAGIVLYEMITGQMLYLEEDLHKLLDMARRADIASPTTLRRGIPPQLEHIVMHALAKSPGDRYQAASDFATDLERFLHAYSPISTSTKVAAMIKKIIGEPVQVPDVEVREGPIATHELSAEDIVHSPDELRDENSMIFSLGDLKRPEPAPAPRVTRQAEIKDALPQQPIVAKPVEARPVRAPTKPRGRHEETREVEPLPLRPADDDSGLLPVAPPPPRNPWDHVVTDHSELDHAEPTMITGAPGGLVMMMDGGAEIEATLVSGAPEPETEDLDDDDLDDQETLTGARPGSHEEEGPTIQRDFSRPHRPTARRPGGAPPPAALSAKIHAPAVSELRKPKPSRKTPSAGMPNVLQQLVGAQVNEPMPAPTSRPQQHTPSGLPLTIATPPPNTPMQVVPGVPSHLQPYAQSQPQPFNNNPYGYPQMSPSALYQFQPHPTPPPMSVTGQMRLFEADEIPSQYKVSRGVPQWLKVGFAGALAVTVAAGVTFFIIRSTQSTPPAVADVRIQSVPAGAEVFFDGVHLSGTTPLTVPSTPAGKRVEVRVELAHHRPYTEMVDIPKQGGDVPFTAILKPLSGKLVIVSTPDGAEVRVDGVVRGRTPATINDIDMEHAKTVELRLKDYQPFSQALKWPASGEVDVDAKLIR